MKRRRALALALALALAIAIAACVPATEDPEPKGGVGFVTVPTAATRGEPFVTTDGWTVHIELLALRVSVVAVPDDGVHGGVESTYTFVAAKPQVLIARALPAGTASTTLSLTTSFRRQPHVTSELDDDGIGAELDARFNQPADDEEPYLNAGPATEDLPFLEPDRPAIVLIARGEKGGRVVCLDVAIAGDRSSADKIVMGVHANALATATVGIAGENLFSKDYRLVFDDFAKADVDGDGHLSGPELRALDLPSCDGCSEAEREAVRDGAWGSSMTEILSARCVALFTAP